MDMEDSSWEGTPYGWLTGSIAGVGSKNTRVNTSALFIGLDFRNGILAMMYAVSSHCICHLMEIWDDMFYIMAQVMLVGRNVKRHSPSCNHKTMLFMGCNQDWQPYQCMHQYLLVQKGQPYITGQFSLLHV